jgi:hypothetical protein
MALLDRVLGTEEPKIPIHQFMAALAEYKRGEVTKQNVVDSFSLSAGESTALQTWLDSLDIDAINRAMIHDVLLLGETGLYSKTQVQSRLGV